MKPFCTCPMTQCPRHPSNHQQGCTPCMNDILNKGKMPACMLSAASDDVRNVKDYTIKGFVDFYQRVKQPHEHIQQKAVKSST